MNWLIHYESERRTLANRNWSMSPDEFGDLLAQAVDFLDIITCNGRDMQVPRLRDRHRLDEYDWPDYLRVRAVSVC